MGFAITAMETDTADRLRADIDTGRVPARRVVLEEPGAPCRHCVQRGAVGDEMLLFTYQPFTGDSPYAVPSPVFLHAAPCTRHAPAGGVPALVLRGGPRAVRSYDATHAIVDGEVVAGGDVATAIDRLLADERAAYVHVHCAVNGCFTFRADRR